MNRAQVIANVLRDLDAAEYRQGFNDSVLSYCRDALIDFDGSGSEFWSLMLRSNRDEALIKFMDNDKDLLNYFDEVDTKAAGPGAFVMPHWGTRGT